MTIGRHTQTEITMKIGIERYTYPIKRKVKARAQYKGVASKDFKSFVIIYILYKKLPFVQIFSEKKTTLP